MEVLMDKNLLLKSFKDEALKDATFRAEYKKLQPEFELIRKLILARKKSLKKPSPTKR